MLLTTAVAMTAAVVLQSRAAGQTVSSVLSDVPVLQQQLYDPGLKQDQRDQVAQRLLSRPDPAARQSIGDALQQYGQPSVQLSACRALADHPTADIHYVTPLFALLDTNSPEPLIDAAGRALTAFKSEDDVLLRLIGLAKDGADERVRLAAIRATGTFVDQRAAQMLIDLLDPSVPPRINAAASDALAYMSGLDASQATPDGWKLWWNNNKGKSAVQFRADVATTRSAQFDRTQMAVGDLQAEFLRVLSDQYVRLPQSQQSDVLVRYLRSPEPAVRVVGCKIARQSAENAIVPAAAVKEQLRQLIGDASPAVRSASAEALALINDPAALMPLLTQLNQEADPVARAALIKALRPIGDVRSTTLLLAALKDPSIDVVHAAADALGELAPKLRQSDPNLADSAAQQLMETVDKRTTAHDDNDLRYSLIQAMIPLQNRGLAQKFVQMLNQQTETPRVRRVLLNALGELHNPQSADTIVNSLNDQDNSVRLAAVKALGASGIPLGLYDQKLADLIDPAKGAPQDLRDATWQVLTGMFAKASAAQLSTWENMAGVAKDPLKRVVVYREERGRARAAKNDDEVASRNQQIGDALSEAAKNDPNYWPEAIAAYSDALSFAKQNNKSYQIEQLSESLTKAHLASGQYETAVKFVQDQIRFDSSLEGTLGPDLRNEADRLVNESKDYDSALKLIDVTLKMDPPLKPQFTRPMQELQAQVKNRTREQNLTPQPSDRSMNAMAPSPVPIGPFASR